MKFSIVIPVYNVEQYLGRCVESIMKQNYTDYEVILIDDGSTDKSSILCDSYAAKDERVVVVHQQNAGVSVARNQGLQYCTGDYVLFVDADDYIRTDTLQVICSILQKYPETDIVSYKNMRVYDTDVIGTSEINGCQLFSREECFRDYLLSTHITRNVTDKAFSRSLFDGVTFPVGKIKAEDFATTYKLLAHANSVVHTDTVLYFYYYREGSATFRNWKDQDFYSYQIGKEHYDFTCSNFPKLKKEATTFLIKTCLRIYYRYWITRGSTRATIEIYKEIESCLRKHIFSATYFQTKGMQLLFLLSKGVCMKVMGIHVRKKSDV